MSSAGSDYGLQEEPEDLEEVPLNPMVESQLERFKLTGEDVKVLIRYRERWKAKKGKDRTLLAVTAYEEILARHSEFGKGTSKGGKEQRKLIREVSTWCSISG
jgi:hypothetical protein